MSTPQHTPGRVCAVPTFERNNYFYGKLITVRDSVQEQRFFNEKRRLINRMILGCGVVCGLDVTWDPAAKDLVVSPGLALDCRGRELLVCEPTHIPFEPFEAHCHCVREKREPPRHRYLVCIEYHECPTEVVELPPLSCDAQERREYNRIRESFRFRVTPCEDQQAPPPDCSPCPESSLPCLDRFKQPVADLPPEATLPCTTPTLHEYLCSRSRAGCPDDCDCDCLPLAVLVIRTRAEPPPVPPRREQQSAQTPTEKPCPAPVPDDHLYVDPDNCSHRRLIYPNPLLYDLIQCHHGDLPHITDFSWRTQTAPGQELDWTSFCELIRRGFTLTFDQPMVRESLTPETFFVTFFHTDEGTGALVPKRIPARSVEVREDRCCTARWQADANWTQDELNAKNSLLARGILLEVVVRGSRVRSRRGLALDGAFIADKLPTGSGVQGTDFVHTFRVRPRGEGQPPAKGFENF